MHAILRVFLYLVGLLFFSWILTVIPKGEKDMHMVGAFVLLAYYAAGIVLAVRGLYRFVTK